MRTLAYKNISGTRWFTTFMDDHTRICWIYILKEKSDAAKIFQIFHSMIKNQFNTSIQTLTTSNGKEYFRSILVIIWKLMGLFIKVLIHIKKWCSGKKNHHLLEVVRALMFTITIPK